MPAAIKAIVIKTAKLAATRSFFTEVLQLPIIESSAKHFVIYSKKVRVVFIDSEKDFGLELYVNDKPTNGSDEIPFDLAGITYKKYKDPNGINIIIIK